MPYYRKKYIRTVGKQKYQQAIRSYTSPIQLPYTNEQIAPGYTWARWGRLDSVNLLSNKADEDQYIPPMLKFRHLRVTFSFPSIPAGGQLHAVKCFILFIPQGITPSFTMDTYTQNVGQGPNGQVIQRTICKHEISGTIKDHPEWVLAQKSTRINTTESTQVTLRPQFTRNLHSGDRIITVVLFLFDENTINHRPMYKYNTDWSYCARVN